MYGGISLSIKGVCNIQTEYILGDNMDAFVTAGERM